MREAGAQQKKDCEEFLAALETGHVEFIGKMEERSLVLRHELNLFKFPVFVQEARVARYRADELRTLDHGRLTITSMRLVFSGLKRTVDMPLAEITVLSAFQNGIKVGRALILEVMTMALAPASRELNEELNALQSS